MNKKNKGIMFTVITCLMTAVFAACGTKDGPGLSLLLEEQGSQSVEAESAAVSIQEAETAFVHICGEVVYPGVYEVDGDSRICDVLLLAGGFTRQADESSVNLAEAVHDGMQVVIPSYAEKKEEKERLEREKAGALNINTASAAQLCSLPGIGESRAAAIVAYREEHGYFWSPEELMQVSGIKEGMYEKIKDRIYVE